MNTILVLSANPKDTPKLRLDQELREIQNGLVRSKRRDEVILEQVWATRPIDVRRAMLDYKPNIVHFCGHGSREEGIAFEDEQGNTKIVGYEALAGFFELFTNVECVILNACYSETQAEAISKNIDYVIGMKSGISDNAAIEFAVAFYDSLGAGELIEFSYKLACNAIQWAGMSEKLTPVLKQKSKKRKRKLLVNEYMDKNTSRFAIKGQERGIEYLQKLRYREEDAYTVVDDEQRLRGILTPSDISYKRNLYEENPNIEVERIMTKNPYSIHADNSLEEALQLMEKKQIITGLPVIDSENRLVGYITREKILRVLTAVDFYENT